LSFEESDVSSGDRKVVLMSERIMLVVALCLIVGVVVSSFFIA